MIPRQTPDASVNRNFLLIALLPAVVMAGWLLSTAHYAFLDDGITVLSSRGAASYAFNISEGGRFMPAYWLYFWGLLRLMPESPVSLAAGNAIAVICGAGLVFMLTRRLSAPPWAAAAAAWFATLNVATVEASFTLSKIETEQLLPWFAALALLVTAGETEGAAIRSLRLALMAISSAAIGLSKETGVLLLVPISVAAVAWWREPRGPRRRELSGLIIAGALPLMAIAATIYSRSLGAGSYAREHVMQGQEGLHWSPALIASKDWPNAALLAAGLAAGALLSLRRTPGARFAAWLAWSQLGVLAAFFVSLRALHSYYLVVPVALAASLACAAVGLLQSAWIRRAGLACLAGLLVWTADHGITAASALTGWSWLYGRLTESVRSGKPRRVLFYRSGGPEVHVEAQLMWNQVYPLGVEVGLLGGPPDGSGLPVVPFRALRAGDWILEQFGAEANRNNPLRDLGVAWPEEYGLTPGRVEVSRHALFRAKYPAPGHGLALLKHRRGMLAWRISVVKSTPDYELEGASVDNWLEPAAALWVSERRRAPIVMQVTPFLPPGAAPSNTLQVVAKDGRIVATCRVARQAPCELVPAQFAGLPAEEPGWIRLALRPERTYSPLQLGLSADPRQLAFQITFLPGAGP